MVEKAWIGRRVVTRQALPDGSGRFSDVVGDLLAVDDEAVVIASRAGVVQVPTSQIAAAKLVEPSTADILALEAVAAKGWLPADIEELGGWLLRANDGFTQRANSVLPLRQLDRPLADAVAAARSWYHARGLPLRLQVPIPARRLLDGSLADIGFGYSPDVVVMAARLELLSTEQRAASVEVEERPSAEWLDAYRHGGKPSSAAGRRLLARHDRAGFALIRQESEPVAVGRGAVDDGWLGITGLEVRADYRRRGLASALLAALWQWGREGQGATHTYLQVSSDNADAIGLYERLGYWEHHRYRYRTER